MNLLKKRYLLWIPLVCLLLIAIYVGTYLPRRTEGFYRRTQTGEIRHGQTQLAITDLAQWNPEDCWWQPRFTQVDGTRTHRGNALGFLYAPLIWIDRKVYYSDRRLLYPEDLGRH